MLCPAEQHCAAAAASVAAVKHQSSFWSGGLILWLSPHSFIVSPSRPLIARCWLCIYLWQFLWWCWCCLLKGQQDIHAVSCWAMSCWCAHWQFDIYPLRKEEATVRLVVPNDSKMLVHLTPDFIDFFELLCLGVGFYFVKQLHEQRDIQLWHTCSSLSCHQLLFIHISDCSLRLICILIYGALQVKPSSSHHLFQLQHVHLLPLCCLYCSLFNSSSLFTPYNSVFTSLFILFTN